MYKNKKFLAIIPARGGSKRLVNKNLLDLNGKPMISWTIEAALNSRFLDDIVVSSDDEKILELAKDYNIYEFKRGKKLSGDLVLIADVIEDVLNKIKKKYDYFVLLQPTSPLRKSFHIDEAIESLISKSADAIVSVCENEHNPLWSNTLPKNLSMSNFLKNEIKNKRGQELPKYYRLNGAIYIVSVKRFLKEKTFFFKDKIYAYIMDKIYSVDIDDEFDFQIAQCLMKRNDNG